MKTMLSTAAGALAAAQVDGRDGMGAGAHAGPWVIERELGRGGMGAVYAVVHEQIGKRAALKIVHRHLLGPGFNADRMLVEARVVNQVGHPNIVDIFETGRLDDGRPYIVMERLDGLSLAHRADDSKLLPDLAIAILLQVCDALIAAHAAGIVHRDLKLDNVFLCDNPDDPAIPKVKVLDWGIAKVLGHDPHHTIDGQLVGTPQYLSPEQARGAQVSPQSDVYSLGVMAYELFLEQLPFEAETSAEVMAMHLRATPPPPAELWPDIPPALEQLVLEMLAKSPEDRPTMLEVARRLEAVRDELRARQRQAYLAKPTCATIVPDAPVIPTLPPIARKMSAGLAPTELADEPRPRRWQWAVGAVAVVASASLFLVSRAGPSSAATAAIAAPTAAAEVAPAPDVAAAPPAATTPADAPAPAIEVAAATPAACTGEACGTPARVIEAAAPPRAVAKHVAPRRHAPRAHHHHGRTASAARTSRRATRGSLAAVSGAARAASIDPDGTLDPYR